jgi:NAD(P)-dependent dehydrogenase (short-subunit alcohol dehydrogenase family)
MGRLENRVALVTGAGSGIGKATARRFSEEGAKVVVVDRTGDEERTANELQDLGGDALAVHADVGDEEQLASAFEAARKQYGQLNVVFNNAGVLGPRAPIWEYRTEDFDRLVSANLRGVFLGLKYGMKELIANGGGSIINTASAASINGIPTLATYAATKGGVLQFTKSAALEGLEHGIRVNCICPGRVGTGLHENWYRIYGENEPGPAPAAQLPSQGAGRRTIEPSEIASLVAFLASDESAPITGSAYTIDFGITAQ